MTIHPDHPFESAAADRDPVRRLRARLVSPVTIWAAAATSSDGRASRAGLTVGSTMLADGDPACIVGAFDPEAELWTAVQASGRFAVTLLRFADHHLADVFAGLAPAPGGAFADGGWQDTAYGPVRAGRSWAGCRLVDHRPVGYRLLVVGAVDEVVIDPDGEDGAGDRGAGDALARFRGRYTAVGPPRR